VIYAGMIGAAITVPVILKQACENATSLPALMLCKETLLTKNNPPYLFPRVRITHGPKFI
jgi:hypothetical protein